MGHLGKHRRGSDGLRLAYPTFYRPAGGICIYPCWADPLLKYIAGIIDEADATQVVSIEPTAPGLDFICRGMRLTSADDQTAVERGCLIYEALYAQLNADSTD